MSVMLVPVDFSDVTPRVVDVASQMARAIADAPLLLHVTAPDPPYVPYEPIPGAAPFPSELEMEDDREKLEACIHRFRGLNYNVTTLQKQGPPTEQILATAAERDARMIVMGTHRHGTVHDLLLGSVTHDVIHHARCPVTVVPAEGAPAPSVEPESPKATFGSILALVDFSDVTPAVMAETERLARAFDAPVMLAHVEPPAPLAVDFAPPPEPDTAQESDHEELARLGDTLRQCGLETTTRVASGQVLEAALRLAKELAPDLIIMGSHGHGALYNLLVGSVTSGILRQVTCPVVVVPAVSRGR